MAPFVDGAAARVLLERRPENARGGREAAAKPAAAPPPPPPASPQRPAAPPARAPRPAKAKQQAEAEAESHGPAEGKAKTGKGGRLLPLPLPLPLPPPTCVPAGLQRRSSPAKLQLPRPRPHHARRTSQDTFVFALEMEDGAAGEPDSVLGLCCPEAARGRPIPEREAQALGEVLAHATSPLEAALAEAVAALLRAEEEEGEAEGAAAAGPGGGAAGLERLAAGLRRAGHASARICRSRRDQADVLRSRQHAFIAVETLEGGEEHVVDPHFKAIVSVARPSRYYQSVLDRLPDVFVGSRARLNKLVAFVGSRLETNFTLCEMHCPPWRDTASLRNTWSL